MYTWGREEEPGDKVRTPGGGEETQPEEEAEGPGNKVRTPGGQGSYTRRGRVELGDKVCIPGGGDETEEHSTE